MAMTREQRLRMFSIAGDLIKSGRSAGLTLGRSAGAIEALLSTGLAAEKVSDTLRATSLGITGYRWAAEQSAANLSFGMRMAAARDPFTVINLQGQYLTESWSRWSNFVGSMTKLAPVVRHSSVYP